jgi:3-hydroxyisobutyrate dehydrogenase-like beta-hydroxyacid dehydrogenase
MEGSYIMDKYTSDLDIEKMITLLVSQTRELLSQHMDILKDMSLQLAHAGELSAAEILKVVAKYDIAVRSEAEGFLKIPAYENMIVL